MKKNQIFEAHDGTQFETAADCKSYELQHTIETTLSELSVAQIRSALSRTDTGLADAFEKAGNIIAVKRRASGDLRRSKKSGALEDVAMGQVPE